MKNPKFIRYLLRDRADLILLLVVISVIIKDFDQNFMWIGLVLYIFGVMWRMGTLMDTLNDNVTLMNLRVKLGLHPITGQIKYVYRTTFAKIVEAIFWLGTIGILVFYIMDK